MLYLIKNILYSFILNKVGQFQLKKKVRLNIKINLLFIYENIIN